MNELKSAKCHHNITMAMMTNNLQQQLDVDDDNGDGDDSGVFE